jgi:quercetin dioxygenase-like cupin family protein
MTIYDRATMTLGQLTAALTEAQMDKVLEMVAAFFSAVKEGVSTLWVILAPALSAYVIYQMTVLKSRQAENRKKLDENSAMTKYAAENTHGHLEKQSKGKEIFDMLQSSEKDATGHEIHTIIELPGFDYVPFELSSGAVALWKQEKCEKGKRVRFSVTGAAEMAFHSHEVSEILTGIKGVLLIESPDGIHMVGPGESFTSPPHQVHAVRFTDYGEILADWPDQVTNELKIIIYRKP